MITIPRACAVTLSLGLALGGCGGSGPSGPTPSAAPSGSATPAALTDTDAAMAFFDAVVAGDRAAGQAVATGSAVAFFEPWGPLTGLTFSPPVDGTFFISPGAAPYQCTVTDAVVQGCLDEPTGEEEDQLDILDPAAYALYEEITPAPGGAPEVVDGAVVRGEKQDAYVVQAVGVPDERLYLEVSSIEDNASVFVFGPDGTELATDTTKADLPLAEAGSYLIVVGPTRGNTTYELSVGISVSAS